MNEPEESVEEFMRKGEEYRLEQIATAKATVPALEYLREFFYKTGHEKYMNMADDLLQFVNDLRGS